MVGQGRPLRSQVLVFLAATLYLGWGVWSVPLASGYTDPVRKVRPQDEALYSSISIGMAERSEWLTPRFLGRLAFVKPILAFLPTALSVRIFGDSLWSLRLFSVLCGAGLLTLFWRSHGWSALLLLAANPLFFTLSRRNMTDLSVLLAVFCTILAWQKWPARAGAALAWGVLTKSVAGIVPVFFLATKGPRVRIAAVAFALIIPWHLYQLATNGEWYWKEHILDEHLQWGLKTPENAAAENHLTFYTSRAWEMDPVLALFAPLALGYCFYRKRYVEAGWLAASITVLFAFGYRNATYLLPVFAATAWAAAPHVHPALAAGVLALRLATGAVSHAPPEPVPPAAALNEYKHLQRPNGLLIDGIDDELVATTMHLPRVQYLLPGDARTLAPTNIDFPGRRIIVNAADFQDRPEPIETVILIHAEADLQQILDRAPSRDFLLRAARLPRLDLRGRQALPERNGWVVVLAQAK